MKRRPSDRRLLRRARWDAEAYRAFYRRYAEPLTAWLEREAGARDVALEIVAETFAHALVEGGRFRGGAALGVFGTASFSRSGKALVPAKRSYVEVTVPGGLHATSIVLATIEFHATEAGTASLVLTNVNVAHGGLEFARCSDSDQFVVPCSGATVTVN